MNLRDQRGASSVEYGLLVAAIAAVVMSVVFVLGLYTQGLFSNTCESLKAGMPSAASSNC